MIRTMHTDLGVLEYDFYTPTDIFELMQWYFDNACKLMSMLDFGIGIFDKKCFGCEGV